MTEPYPPENLLDAYRSDLQGIEDSIHFWERPGAMAAAINMGGEIKDGTQQLLEDLRRSAQQLRDLIASVEAKQNG